MKGEFYIGYHDPCPPGLARGVRRSVLVLIALLFPALGWVAFQQAPVGDGVFEYGHLRDWEGTAHMDPIPFLESGDTHGSWLLVGKGKFGATDSVRPFDGLPVRVRGTAIHDGEHRMIEVLSIQHTDESHASGGRLTSTSPRSTNEVILRGELVDTKCQFGVMRPGNGKVHRACAARCLSGGVPPGILIRAPEGTGRVVVLVGELSRPPFLDVKWAGLRVSALGTLERIGDLEVLRVRRISPDEVP